ncbi:MAG: tyrosine-type recombinase/integrase [Oscillospiraceae bacterium]
MLSHVYAALTPQNALIIRVCEKTGLRLGDVLNLRTEQIKPYFTIIEQKTGKRRRIYLSAKLRQELLNQAGAVFVFEGRNDPQKHKTRQAVWYDVKRAKHAFRIKENLAPHSLRKVYAVAKFKRTGDISKVQRLLNHDSTAVTAIYAMADILTQRKKKKQA